MRFFTASHCILTASPAPSPLQAKQQRSRTERLSAKGLVPAKVCTRGTQREAHVEEVRVVD